MGATRDEGEDESRRTSDGKTSLLKKTGADLIISRVQARKSARQREMLC
jgi:hypothetical protein